MKLNSRLLLGLWLVGVVLVAIPLVAYLVQSSRALQSARLQRAGIAPSKALVRLVRVLQQHRGLSAGALGWNTALEAQRAAKQVEVDGAINAFSAVMMWSDIRDPEVRIVWRGTLDAWRALANAVSSHSITDQESVAKHTALIEDHLRLLDLLLDYFRLSRDLQAHDYHLIAALLSYTPALTESLGQMRARGTLLLTKQSVILADRIAINGFMANAKTQQWARDRELGKAVALHPQLKAEAGEIVQTSSALARKVLNLAWTEVVEAETLRYPPVHYYAVFTQAIDGQFELIDHLMVHLETGIEARVNASQNEQRTTLGVMALMAGLAVWLGRRVIRAAQQDIAVLRQSMALRETIYTRSALFSRSLELQEVCPAFAEAVKAFLPFDRIGIVVPHEEESLVAVLAVAEPPMRHYQGRVWHPRGGTAVNWVLTHRTPRLIQDLNTEQTFTDEAFAAREGMRATLMVPLIVGSETVGVLVADSRTAGVYTDEHVELSQLMAEPLSIAIQNAGLYAQIARHAEALEEKVEERTRELRTVNAQLEAASRHKSAFLANMSHELRTPLNAIMGFSELLRDQTGGSLTAKQARYTNHIHSSGRHLLALINDLLDLSKVEAGKLTLCPEPFVLSEALTAALRDMQPVADTKRLTLALDAETAPAVLTADPVRFKQIVFNLLSNAVKFTPEGGRITVTSRHVWCAQCREQGVECASDAESVVKLVVTDTGIGIAVEDLPKLFQRFSQLETTKQSQGSGLGLALTKQLVELHGGTMTAASAGPGQGSSFTVCLPLASDASRDMGEGR